MLIPIDGGAAAYPQEVPQALGQWRAPKVSQRVARQIVEEIISRGLRPGDRLPPEAETMERFEISRASLREGLRVLETFGVIRVQQGQRGGPRIEQLSPTDLARTLSLFFQMFGATYRDVFDARVLIEPVMARIAAERQDPEQMQALRGLLELEKTTPAESYFQVANSFHETASGLSGNPVLDLIGQALRAFYAEYFFRVRAVPEVALERCRKDHPQIAEAILAGDADRAETLAREHMAKSRRFAEQNAAWMMDARVSWEV
jgi:DNA-binding FadR family transcriptional regulator